MAKVTIRVRRDTTANWVANNPVLADGEIAIEKLTGSSLVKIKIGDGTTAWNTLLYSVDMPTIESYAIESAASQVAAAASAEDAKTSETNAKTSETNAKTSETSANTSAGVATTQAGIATTGATTATTKAGEALGSKNAAGVSEINAGVSAVSAASSASTAAAIINAIPYATKALMDADLAHEAPQWAKVIADVTPDNNAFYAKQGISGSGSWLKDTSIVSLPDNSVNHARMGTSYLAASLVQGTVAITEYTKTVVFAGTMKVLTNRGILTPTPATLTYTDAGYLYCYLDMVTLAFTLADYTNIATICNDKNKAFMFMSINGRVYANNLSFYTINNIPRGGQPGAVAKGTLINAKVTVINKDTKTVVVAADKAGPIYVFGQRGIKAATAASLTFTDGGFNYLFFDMIAGTFSISDYSTIISSLNNLDKSLICVIYNSAVYGVDNPGSYSVNGISNGGIPTPLRKSTILDAVVTITNNKTKTIDIAKNAGANLYVMTERGVLLGTPITLTFTDAGFNYLYFDTVALTFAVADVTNNAAFMADNTKSLLAVLWNGKVYSADNMMVYTVNGVINGGWVGSDGSEYNTALARIVMPDKLYLVKDIPYTINGVNVVSPLRDWDSHRVSLELPLLSKVAKSSSNIDLLISEECTLNTQLAVFSKGFINTLFKNLSIKVKNKANVVNPATPSRVMCIGDSLTNSSLPPSVKWWLNKWGITSEMIGTVNNNYNYDYPFPGLPAGVDTLGEGRGGWWLTDYAGGLNYVSGGLCMRDGNPFWNPSTQAFDAAYYLAQTGKSGFDFVTIELGTNDVSGSHILNTVDTPVTIPTFAQVLAYYPTKLDLIIASLKAVNPNVKIAIIPPAIVGANEVFNEQYRLLADVAITHYAGREDVVVLGTYMSVGLYASPTYADLTRPVVSATNNSMRATASGNVHFGGHTQISNACWIASWIANML